MPTPRRTFSRFVVGSRWSGLTQRRLRQRWLPLERLALVDPPAVVVVADGAGPVEEDAWRLPLERELLLLLAAARERPLLATEPFMRAR